MMRCLGGKKSTALLLSGAAHATAAGQEAGPKEKRGRLGPAHNSVTAPLGPPLGDTLSKT